MSSTTEAEADTPGPETSLAQQTVLYEEALDFIKEHQKLLREMQRDLERRIRQNRTGIEGETQVLDQALDAVARLGASSWQILVDRQWPGSKGNIDLILVGPPGILILDAKNWREPRIVDGRLWRGDDLADDQIRKVQDQADAVAGSLSDDGLAPTAVIPLLVLAGQDVPPVDVDGVRVLGRVNLHAELVRLPHRLNATEVQDVAVRLALACPSRLRATGGGTPRTKQVEAPGTPTDGDTSEQTELISRDDIWDRALEAASAAPVEVWMTWLHPAQTKEITRSHGGPARIRGAAGTGKTVLALHRARQLSRDAKSRVLVTTFVRTLPQVQKSLFELLSPSTTDRVEFTNLHTWALRFLHSREVSIDLGEPGRNKDSVFAQSWASSGVGRDLASTGLPMQYWKDEIAHVIKGRGLNDVTDYLELTRVGRRFPLRAEQRLLVWALFEEYQRRLAAEGLHDFEDVITNAFAGLVREPLDVPYTAVIVDEAQDLSCEGMRLLHTLVGDRRDGLLVVGDGQQAVYPGGFTLREAGINIQGRSTVLNKNYRNGSEILKTAFDVVHGDQFPDLDDDELEGGRDCETDRAGGVVRTFPTVDRRSQRVELIADVHLLIEAGTRPGDIAVLARTTAAADGWMAALEEAGIQNESLAAYSGSPSDCVKVGTYQRAKGLEFSAVYIPDLDLAITRAPNGTAPESRRDRNEIERRCLFVAMTRARDRLWLGRVAADNLETPEKPVTDAAGSRARVPESARG